MLAMFYILPNLISVLLRLKAKKPLQFFSAAVVVCAISFTQKLRKNQRRSWLSVKMRLCCCKHLQTGVLIGVSISFVMWLGLLIFYIPYVLLLLPTQLDPEDLLESGAVIPHENYSTFMVVAAIVILLALFVDRDGLQYSLIPKV